MYTVYGYRNNEWQAMDVGLTEADAKDLMRDMKQEGHYAPSQIVAKKEKAIVLKVQARYANRVAIDNPQIVEVIEDGVSRKPKDADFNKAVRWLMDSDYIPFGQPVLVGKHGYFKTYKHTYHKKSL